MKTVFSNRLSSLSLVKRIRRFLKKVKIGALEGLSVYELLSIYGSGLIKGALGSRASAIAFSIFMALFPLIIFLVTLIPFVIPYIKVGNQPFDTQFLLFLESFLPQATGEYFGEVFKEIKEQKSGGLLSSSFIISIFLMANGVNAIFAGFEKSYHIELERHFFKQYAYALMVGLIISLLILVGAVAYVYFEFYVLEFLSEWAAQTRGYDLTDNHIVGAQVGKVVFLILVSYLVAAILYYFGTAEGKQAKFFSWGALMTTLLFMMLSYLFGIYIDNFARYNELYGALGGLLILMVFIWLNSNILLLGFELNATLNRLRKRNK